MLAWQCVIWQYARHIFIVVLLKNVAVKNTPTKRIIDRFSIKLRISIYLSCEYFVRLNVVSSSADGAIHISWSNAVFLCVCLSVTLDVN